MSTKRRDIIFDKYNFEQYMHLALAEAAPRRISAYQLAWDVTDMNLDGIVALGYPIEALIFEGTHTSLAQYLASVLVRRIKAGKIDWADYHYDEEKHVTMFRLRSREIPSVSPPRTKPCQNCGERIRLEAVICRHCGHGNRTL
jgi:hypothetical protein